MTVGQSLAERISEWPGHLRGGTVVKEIHEEWLSTLQGSYPGKDLG